MSNEKKVSRAVEVAPGRVIEMTPEEALVHERAAMSVASERVMDPNAPDMNANPGGMQPEGRPITLVSRGVQGIMNEVAMLHREPRVTILPSGTKMTEH